MRSSPNTTPEEKISLLEAKTITLIHDLKENPDIMQDDIQGMFLTLTRALTGVNKYIRDRVPLFGKNIDSLTPLYDSILIRLNFIKNNEYKDKSDLFDRIRQDGNYLEFYIFNDINKIPYEVRNNISNSEFVMVYDDLVRQNLNLRDYINIETYSKVDNPNREILSKTIIELKNKFNNLGDMPEDRDSLNPFLETLKSINVLNNLQSHIEEIKDSHQILTTVKENTAKENISKLNTGYETEASKLTTKINSLNNQIVVLFTTIIISISIKTILVLMDMENIKDLYSFFVFISLIISCSALTTYLIKERNRLIKLHDHYKMNVLELSTLPEYMRELDSNQRQSLIITLSNNYFRGSNDNLANSNLENNKINEITSTLENLTKLIKEIKDTTK